MKKTILILSFLFTCYITAQNTHIDVVYLKNGSVIKGIVTELIVTENLTIRTDNGSIIIAKMTDVKQIVKQQNSSVDELNNLYSRQENIDVAIEKGNSEVEVVEDSEEIEEKPKKKGRFWKALGNIVVSTLDNTAKNIRNKESNKSSYESEYDTIEGFDDVSKKDTSVGSICFVNPNYYSRKIILINVATSVEKIIVVGNTNYGKTTKSCAYDLPIGVYNCNVYTTFSKKIIEQYQIRITSENTVSQQLTKNQYN